MIGYRGIDGFRRATRVTAWNVLFLLAGLALVVVVGEVWIRSIQPAVEKQPFTENTVLWDFSPRVGSRLKPNSEVRFTNGRDFWTVTRINSLGFPDREPIDGKRAAESCHVAVIGDSIVEGLQVSIDEKLHIQLEELAARRLPDLDVTASAWGLMGTGQIAQTAFYDEFVRRMNPNLLVLVFVPNDFIDNVPLLNAINTGYDPDRLPQRSAERDKDGFMVMRPPGGESRPHKLPPPPLPPERRAKWPLRFLNWLESLASVRSEGDRFSTFAHRSGVLAERPRYAPILADGPMPRDAYALVKKASPRVREYALEYTSFGLDRFKERADRDGVHLVILSIQQMRERQSRGASPLFDALRALARTRGVPVIDQYDHAIRQGVEIFDLRWKHDGHWNPLGHRLAAEALVEWLAGNRRVCDDGDESSPVDDNRS